MRLVAIVLMFLGHCTLAWANPAHEQVRKMSANERNTFFAQFLRRSGKDCHVTRNFYQGSTKGGDAFWNVACKGKDGYSIMIRNDASGSTRILECRVLKAVTGTSCFVKLK